MEQKNWAVARRTAGYWRYETPGEMAVLNQVWTALSPLTNLFTPQQKLVSKTRVGAKVTKKYDTAKTPYQRLLGHPDVLDAHDTKMLAKRFQTTNPAQLRREIGDLQGDLLNKVRHKNITRRGKQNATYLSRAKLDESTNHAKRASRHESSGTTQAISIPRDHPRCGGIGPFRDAGWRTVQVRQWAWPVQPQEIMLGSVLARARREPLPWRTGGP